MTSSRFVASGIAHSRRSRGAVHRGARADCRHAESRLKDIVTLAGHRVPSPLMGYGLVVGLNKTGDKRQTIFSTQSLANMLSRLRRGGAGRPDEGREHRGRARHRRDVAVSAHGRAHRRDRLVDRRRAEPAGRHAAARRRCADPTARWRALAQGPLSIGGFGGGGGGVERAGQPPDGGADSRRRDRPDARRRRWRRPSIA